MYYSDELQASSLSVIRSMLHTRLHLHAAHIRRIVWEPSNSSALSKILGTRINLLKPTGHVMHQQFNIQQLYALPTLYLCVLYLSENKQRLVPLTA